MASTELRTAAQQALEALKRATPADSAQAVEQLDAITALKAALAEPVQEPATLPGPGLVMCPACCAQFDPALNLVEPVQEPDSPERRCGGPGCDLKCCQPVEEPVAREMLEQIKEILK